jgi:glycosyltransferase involved in cell wall biosynthesis
LRTEHGNPKVSVFIITYNSYPFIIETVESVLRQDYENIEIIISDDCSTDMTVDFLKEISSKYPNKIKLILNETNKGITKNSNTAFFACSGDLLAVLGGDDIFMPGKLRKQVEVFENNPDVVLCYHPVEIFDSETDKTLFITNQTVAEDPTNVLEIISKIGIPGASSVMVRKDACPSYGYDERIPNASDWKFAIDVAFKGRIVKVNEILGRYRKSKMGISNRAYELLEESLNVLDIVKAEHKDFFGLEDAIKTGKARYLAGVAYEKMIEQ